MQIVILQNILKNEKIPDLVILNFTMCLSRVLVEEQRFGRGNEGTGQRNRFLQR